MGRSAKLDRAKAEFPLVLMRADSLGEAAKEVGICRQTAAKWAASLMPDEMARKLREARSALLAPAVTEALRRIESGEVTDGPLFSLLGRLLQQDQKTADVNVAVQANTTVNQIKFVYGDE